MAKRKKKEVAPPPIVAEAIVAPDVPVYPAGKTVYLVFGPPDPSETGRMVTDPENASRPGVVEPGWVQLYSVCAPSWADCMRAFNAVEGLGIYVEMPSGDGCSGTPP